MNAGKTIDRAAANTQTARWYIVKTKGGEERLARESLMAEGFDVYLPVYPKFSKKMGGMVGHPLFINYLFVRLTLGAIGWTKVFSTRGVRSVLCNGLKPSPMDDKVIDAIRSRELKGFVQMGITMPARAFKKGEAIKVKIELKDGFEGEIDAIFSEAIDSKRCVVLLKLLGDSERLAQVALAHIK